MEEHNVNHIRTVLLVTLSILLIIILYYRLLKHFQKNMDKKLYAVLLPFEYLEDKMVISIEVPRKTEVLVDLLDSKENIMRSLLKGDQEAGVIQVVVGPKDLSKEAKYLRMISDGQNILRKLTE